MTVTAPPRPPRPSDPVEREEVEALIEEARQRARRRRRVRMAVVACVVFVGATVFAVFERTAESQSSSPAAAAGSGVAGGKVKVVIAGTNDSPFADTNRAGRGTFRASGAITDAGTVLGYRTVSADNSLITLRFVTKGRKGTITYLVKIHTNLANPDAASRWTITSGTKAYEGLHGKGTTSVNASYTVRILRGTVSR